MTIDDGDEIANNSPFLIGDNDDGSTGLPAIVAATETYQAPPKPAMTAEQTASGEPATDAMLADALMQLTDRAMRLEVALRLIRYFAMGEILQRESGAVRDWLRDWIDGVYGSGGPGGPLLWPAALANCCQIMRGWGFEPSARDENGLSYVVLRRQTDDGEAVQ